MMAVWQVDLFKEILGTGFVSVFGSGIGFFAHKTCSVMKVFSLEHYVRLRRRYKVSQEGRNIYQSCTEKKLKEIFKKIEKNEMRLTPEYETKWYEGDSIKGLKVIPPNRVVLKKK